MSLTSYCRVKWIINAGELKRDEVESWTDKVECDLIEIRMDNGFSISWTLVVSATSTAVSPYFYFTLEKRTLCMDGFNVLVSAKSEHKKEGYDVENGPWGCAWKIRKDEFAEMLFNSHESACTFNILFSVEKKATNQISLHDDKSNNNIIITVDNVLQMLNIPEVQESKELMGKCTLLVMNYYKDLKNKDEWNKIHPSIMAKIKDLPLDMEPQTREIALVEHQSEDEEDDNQREMKEDLIYKGEFASEDDFDDFEDDMEIF